MEKPFTTEVSELAAALIAAGFPPTDENEICLNIYTRERPFVGLESDPDKPAKPGHVEYIFKGSDKLNECVALWDAEVERIEKAAKRARASGDATIDGPTLTGDYPGDIILLAVWLFHTHGETRNLWRKVDPKIWARKKGKTRSQQTPNGGTRTIEPGFVLISRNTPPEELKRMKIQV